MEPLAFIEVLGRHNDVQARYPVFRWPACVGRAYDAEVILDDPFVAPRHLRIEPAADGRFSVSDLASLNGISLPPSGQRVAQAEVGPDDVVRLGRTQIRIRSAAYAVPAEQRLRATALYRRPGAFAIAAATLLGVTLWSAWVSTTSEDEWPRLLLPIVMISIGAGVWISVWSLVSRTVGGRANFAAHGFVACASLVVIAAAGTLFEYLSFGFDARWLDAVASGVLAALVAYMLYRHLRLNSRAPRARLAVVAATVVAGAFGIAVGLEQAAAPAREGVQPYDATLKPPLFLRAPGVPPEAFLAESDALRRAADAAAREDGAR
ncbi:MAG: FHA domain-containing protein [Burkholderiales bacterium]|nr:FHA domain-containing protein [Burkholderiales bacterium]